MMASFNSWEDYEWDLTIDTLPLQHQTYPSHVHYQLRIPRQSTYIGERTMQIYDVVGLQIF